jgi:hypothetical protein
VEAEVPEFNSWSLHLLNIYNCGQLSSQWQCQPHGGSVPADLRPGALPLVSLSDVRQSRETPPSSYPPSSRGPGSPGVYPVYNQVPPGK